MSERSDLHYVTSPEGEWRCSECQQLCHDDARCDCCDPKVSARELALVTEELRNITDHLADFHEDNPALMLLVVNAYNGGPTAVIEAIRDGWLYDYDVPTM